MTQAYPFNDFHGVDLAQAYVDARERPGLTSVRLPHGEPAWLVTRHDEARFVLADKRFSRAEAANRDAPRVLPRSPVGIVSMDPPDLSRIRGLAAKAFTPRRAEALRPHVRALTADLIDAMVETGPPADLVRDFALPIPISVICALLGVPPADQEKFRRWNDNLLSTSALTPEQSGRNLAELQHYVLELIELRRSEPADDLITALVQARDVDDRLSTGELVLLCIAILVAGYEATASQIPNFVHTLLAAPAEFARLRADPGLVDTAVEELLRFIPLASCAMFPHYAKEDVRVGDVVVRAGEPVLVSIGAANHDPLAFPDPTTLDLTRDARAHLAFGHGLHHCVGSALARVELQEALRALVTRLPGLRLAGPVEWKTATFFRGPHALPITW
ncbi:cytochrome P450 [Umezawaea sp. NPDC059074]|uniref:cytochrome P450 n=1 Tax=Umezawaea sp. NPDC059074 TaxID=3346716 RepID=UPI0036A283D7